MNSEPEPNHTEYLKALDRMTEGQRLKKAFELSTPGRSLFRAGLKQAFPELSDDKFEELYRERLALCHNRNW